MRMLPIALMLLAPTLHAAPPAHAADPASLFEGRSEGRGTLRLGLGHARAYRVDNIGHREADGSFRLDQIVHFDGEPPQPRHWRIVPAGDGRYTFTLSDAAGPGVALADDARLRLRYAPRHGLRMHQVLERRSDGAISNVGTIRLLGLPIGRLRETIVPLP